MPASLTASQVPKSAARSVPACARASRRAARLLAPHGSRRASLEARPVACASCSPPAILAGGGRRRMGDGTALARTVSFYLDLLPARPNETRDGPGSQACGAGSRSAAGIAARANGTDSTPAIRT